MAYRLPLRCGLGTVSRGLGALAISAVLVSAPRPAAAEPRASDEKAAHKLPLSQSLRGSAKDAFTAASVLVRNGDFAGALVKYEEAYATSKDPRLLFNMALCARSQHDYAHMQTLLGRYLRESGSALSADDKRDVDAALGAIRMLIGTVVLTVNEPGATVQVDGQPAGTTPLDGPLVQNLGKHKLLISKSGFAPVEQTVEVAGGKQTSLEIHLNVQALPSRAARFVLTTDENAMIVVDGQKTATGRFEDALSPGAHEVRVTLAGKKAYQTSLELRAGELRTVSVSLEDEQGAPLWPWIAGGAAVVVGAAVGGFLLLRPKDETLAVPNGGAATVPLAVVWR